MGRPLFDFGIADVIQASRSGALVTFRCRCMADVDADGRIRATVSCLRQLAEHSAAWREGKGQRGCEG